MIEVLIESQQIIQTQVWLILVYFLPKIDSSKKVWLWKEQQTKMNAGKRNNKQDKQKIKKHK